MIYVTDDEAYKTYCTHGYFRVATDNSIESAYINKTRFEKIIFELKNIVNDAETREVVKNRLSELIDICNESLCNKISDGDYECFETQLAPEEFFDETTLNKIEKLFVDTYLARK